MQNLSYENEYDSHENELVGRTHFHVNGLKQRLVLTQSRNWAITYFVNNSSFAKMCSSMLFMLVTQ